MEKLIYKKYKGLENIITIDLHNGYTIIAISSWNKESHHYNADLYLKDNLINNWLLIENVENLIINANYKTIHSALLKQVASFLKEGFFERYIKRYEYEQKCFEKGNELLEKELLKRSVMNHGKANIIS